MKFKWNYLAIITSCYFFALSAMSKNAFMLIISVFFAIGACFEDDNTNQE